jgi:hypothetical protein
MNEKSRTHLMLTLPYCQNHGYHSLLDVALNVRMSATGALDRNLEEQKKDVMILKYVLEMWRNSLNQSYERFDGAVKELILAALEENRQFLQKTKLQKFFDSLDVNIEEEDINKIRK